MRISTSPPKRVSNRQLCAQQKGRYNPRTRPLGSGQSPARRTSVRITQASSALRVEGCNRKANAPDYLGSCQLHTLSAERRQQMPEKAMT